MPVQHLQLIEPDAAGELASPRLRIAIASDGLKALDSHFGSARRFAIYDVMPEESRFVEAVGFDIVSDRSSSHRSEGDDKIGAKVTALCGCHLLFVLAIGGPAAARVVNSHIHPVKLAVEESIDSIISRVQAMMIGNPPPWLRKVMQEKSGQRSMDFLDE